MTAGILQLAAWSAAFWLAVALHARHAAEPLRRARFIGALVVGALLARAGHALFWGEPRRMLEPGADLSILFFPLGVLALAPHVAAFASLPLALALARLGCLPAGCCRGVGGELLPAFEATAWVAVHFVLVRATPDRVAERFAFAFGGLRLVQAPWRLPVSAVVTPELVALAWLGAGAALRIARRRRSSVTNPQRFLHASPTAEPRRSSRRVS